MYVSENGRYLVNDDGTPFFYLADTAWALFYNVSLEDAEYYLRVRKEQGFTVIMPVLVWDVQGYGRAAYGRRPFVDFDPAKPDERFFRHVDQVIEKANELGLVMALLPTWGHYVAPAKRGRPEVLTPENAGAYGEFLGRRYRDCDVIWVLGGDRNPAPEEAQFVAVWPAMAEGLKAGDGGRHLMTYHPTAVHSSSEWFHSEPWLDFNMWQTSTRIHVDYCQMLLQDHNRTPVKPFVDGETRYEHSHRFFYGKPPCSVRMTPRRVRQAAYYAMLCGAMGHTYGCRDAWSFYVPCDQPPPIDIDTYWKDALRFPAAEQVRHLRKLFTDHPWYALIPDQENALVVHGSDEGNLRIQGAIAQDATFAVIYIPDDMPVWVDLARLSGKAVDARWFDPITGEYAFVQRYCEKSVTSFYWAGNIDERDHVLVLSAVQK